MPNSILYTLLIFLTICSCESETSKWEHAKKNNTIYPVDSLVKYKYKTLGADSEVVWVNQSYQNYPFKNKCKSSVIVTFDLNNPFVQNGLPKDSLGIAKMLLDDFRKEGVSHFLGQIYNSKNLIVYLHNEEGFNPIQKLADFKILCSGRFQEDEDWDTFNQLIYIGKYQSNPYNIKLEQ